VSEEKYEEFKAIFAFEAVNLLYAMKRLLTDSDISGIEGDAKERFKYRC
jgi:hypothetical protein